MEEVAVALGDAAHLQSAVEGGVRGFVVFNEELVARNLLGEESTVLHLVFVVEFADNKFMVRSIEKELGTIGNGKFIEEDGAESRSFAFVGETPKRAAVGKDVNAAGVFHGILYIVGDTDTIGAFTLLNGGIFSQQGSHIRGLDFNHRHRFRYRVFEGFRLAAVAHLRHGGKSAYAQHNCNDRL